MAFWSAVVKPGKKPTPFVPPPENWTLHLSQAALPASVPEGKRVSLLMKLDAEDPEPVIICTLTAGRLDTVPLDLFLDRYAEFQLDGFNAEVHLTGYFSPPDELAAGLPDSEEDEEYEEEDEMMVDPALLMGGGLGDDSDEDDEDGEDDEDDEDEDDDEPGVTRRPHVTIEEVTEEEEGKKAKAKTPAKAEAKTPAKSDAKTPAKSDAKTPAKSDAKTDKADKQQQSAKKEPQANGKQTPGQKRPAEEPAQPASSKKQNAIRTWENGFAIEELAMGQPNGKLAKRGKKVHMYYVGKLKSNGKVFDSTKGGKAFVFRLGVGEVIKGWDLGVEGMRVGDKRRLTIPPQLAYGTQGVKGAIPPNATLLFDVELVDVK